MKPVRHILRSERGDLMVENIVATTVVGITLGAVSGILVTSSAASATVQTKADRTSYISSVLAQEAPRVGAYTSEPATVNYSISGAELPVTIWREDPDASTAILHAAVPGYGTTGATACADPTSLSGCLTASTAVPLDSAGIVLEEIPFIAGAGATLGTAKIAPGVAEVRYIFKVTEAPDLSALQLTTSPGTATENIEIPAGQTGYYYGTLQVDPDTTIKVTAPGSATIDRDSILLYESPTP